jgi:hypothetical protein
MIFFDMLVKYWVLVLAVAAAVSWLFWLHYSIAALEKQFREMREKTYVTNMVCGDRRAEITTLSALEFKHGADQFTDIKKLISYNDKQVQDRLQEIRQILMNQVKR